MTTKLFDCVAMKHDGARRAAAWLADLSDEERLAHWWDSAEMLRQRRALSAADRAAAGRALLTLLGMSDRSADRARSTR